MRIDSSSLTLRFYERFGWSEAKLQEYTAVVEKCAHYDEDLEDRRYWVIPLYSHSTDIARLAADCTKLVRTFDDYPRETDEQFIRRML